MQNPSVLCVLVQCCSTELIESLARIALHAPISLAALHQDNNYNQISCFRQSPAQHRKEFFSLVLNWLDVFWGFFSPPPEASETGHSWDMGHQMGQTSDLCLNPLSQCLAGGVSSQAHSDHPICGQEGTFPLGRLVRTLEVFAFFCSMGGDLPAEITWACLT